MEALVASLLTDQHLGTLHYDSLIFFSVSIEGSCRNVSLLLGGKKRYGLGWKQHAEQWAAKFLGTQEELHKAGVVTDRGCLTPEFKQAMQQHLHEKGIHEDDYGVACSHHINDKESHEPLTGIFLYVKGENIAAQLEENLGVRVRR